MARFGGRQVELRRNSVSSLPYHLGGKNRPSDVETHPPLYAEGKRSLVAGLKTQGQNIITAGNGNTNLPWTRACPLDTRLRLRFAAVWMGLAGPAATEPWMSSNVLSEPDMNTHLPSLRLSSRCASPLFLAGDLPRFWTLWLGCLLWPGPETEEALEGRNKGLQTGSGSRLFRLGSQGQACWAPIMQARSREPRYNDGVRNARCEAEASPSGRW